MGCYSDHNEDIRTKGSCDLCGGSEADRMYWASTSTKELAACLAELLDVDPVGYADEITELRAELVQRSSR